MLAGAARLLRKLGPRQIAEAWLVAALWSYTASVLSPAKALRRSGVAIVGPPVGEEPVALPRPGLGRHFSKSTSAPVLLEEPSHNQHLVEEFDELAEFYEVRVRPFSTPIFDQALATIRKYLASDSRVMDAGCGPGRELRRVASLVPQGEAVGIDLAEGMVKVAYASARARGLDNCAFFRRMSAASRPASMAGSMSSTAASPTIITPPRLRRRRASCAACARAVSTV
jgi:Methyltransferase domain